ncbi:MAG: tetratricopeptide repeat protein, partial [Gemmatimonadetes bacterium]|nr:tetratricopeptide repeat protein [Gemmatimonadota bacterium]
LGALAAGLLAGVAGRRGGRTAGLATGLLAATAWPLLVFGRELLIASLIVPLGALILWQTDRALERGGLRRWLGVGLAIGLAVLARPNFLLVGAAVAGAALIGARPGRFRSVLVLAAGVLVLLAPVSVRNRVVSGEWIPLSYQAGLNLWIGNNPEADGLSARLPGFTSWRNEDVETALALEYGRSVGPAEQDRHYRRLALGFFRDEPVAAMKLLAKKTYYFLQGYEIRNNRDLYSLRDRNGLLKLPLPDFGWILPLAGVGLWSRRRRLGEIAPWLAFAAAGAASVILFFVCSRYRLVAWPPLLALAGLGVAFLLDRGEAFRSRAVGVGVLVLLVALAHVDFLNVRHPDPSQPHFQYGNIYARAGQPDVAEAEYRRALALAPGFGEAHYHLGALLLGEGRVAEAIPELERGAQAMPRSYRVRRSLAEALELAGRGREALAVRDEAARLSVGHPDDRAALANAYGMNGNFAEAWKIYQGLLNADLGDDPFLDLNAGQTALALKKETEGFGLLERAATDPRTRREAYEAQARYLLSMRRTKDALRVLSDAILKVRDEPRLHRLRALARYANGDVTGAIQDLERVVELDPTDTASRQRLEDVRAGREPR